MVVTLIQDSMNVSILSRITMNSSMRMVNLHFELLFCSLFILFIDMCQRFVFAKDYIKKLAMDNHEFYSALMLRQDTIRNSH